MSREPSREGRGRPASFSLVEMLVAVAILSIVMAILLGTTTSILTAWQLGQARNQRRTMGQTVMDRIARDLRQAALPLSRSSSTSLQFVVNPGGVSASYEFPQAVFWQAPVATDGGINGNMAVVGYFIQWINGVPSLSRCLINPSAANYLVYSSPAAWITDSILQNSAPATPVSGYAGLLAENVLGLWVQVLDPQGNPIRQSTGVAGASFDSRLAYAYTNSVYTTVPSTNAPSVLPSSVQIAILIVDARTAQKLTGTEKPAASSLTGNFWGDIQAFAGNLPANIRKGAEIQTTTVDLVNGPR